MAALAVCAACGSKTGLRVPDAGEDDDAGLCVRSRLPLEQRTPEILFVVDRSRSMEFNLEGDEAAPGEIRRWDVLGDALVRALRDREDALGFGILLYPDPPTPVMRIEDVCVVDSRIDVPIAPANVDQLQNLFATEDPSGGTPTALALRRARGLLGEPRRGVQRFVVLATDGAPNCNPNPPLPPPLCVCTSSEPEVCNNPESGPFQCLDDAAAVDAVTDLSMEDGIPVYVIGISDSSRPQFRATLDAMAVAGTRPRPAGGSRFYDVERPEDLDAALETITDSIEQCVFYLTRSGLADQIETLRTSEGVRLPHDPSRVDGWDVTNAPAGEITLFGPTCRAVAASREVPTAFTGCRE